MRQPTPSQSTPLVGPSVKQLSHTEQPLFHLWISDPPAACVPIKVKVMFIYNSRTASEPRKGYKIPHDWLYNKIIVQTVREKWTLPPPSASLLNTDDWKLIDRENLEPQTEGRKWGACVSPLITVPAWLHCEILRSSCLLEEASIIRTPIIELIIILVSIHQNLSNVSIIVGLALADQSNNYNYAHS